MTTDTLTRLKAALRALHTTPGPPALDLRPTNPFEIQVAERLHSIDAELDQLRTRINWLLTIIVGAAITNIVIALLK